MRNAIHERLYICIFLYSLKKKIKLKSGTHHSFSLPFVTYFASPSPCARGSTSVLIFFPINSLAYLYNYNPHECFLSK